MQDSLNPFKPPTYDAGSISASADSVNVPLTPSQPPGGGELPAAKRGVLFFHILFKVLALLVYLTANMWGTSYVLTFVLVTLLMAMGACGGLARGPVRSAPGACQPLRPDRSALRSTSCADFWTVKNISGRLLVGLRWWNVVDEDGKSHWHFQSFEDQRFVHPTDSNVFWLALFAAPVIWALLSIAALLSFKFMWFLLVNVALGLSAINAYGYVRCKRDASKKLTALGGTVLTRGLQAWSGMQRRAGGGGGGGGASAPPI